MGVRDRYASAAAFRAALEDRLRAQSGQSGVSGCARKPPTTDCFVACTRRHPAAGDQGGFALILRLGALARATRDVDANWRAAPTSLEDALSIVEEVDDGDWFTCV